MMINKKGSDDIDLKLDFWGDISLAFKSDIPNYILEVINYELEKSDYCIANLESPIIYNTKYAPIIKDGPNLCTTVENSSFYKNLHIDCYTLANNHIGDYGVEGIMDTIDSLRRMNKEYIGTSKEIRDTYLPLRKEYNGIKFSVFSFCENEFGIVTNSRQGAAGYNPAIIKELLQNEKNVSDYIFVVFHGGTEYYPFPTPKQKERYHLLVDWGANYVFGMHSHCPQGYEIYNHAYIFYGLGNFFFPRKLDIASDGWSFGYGVRLYVNKEKIEHEIIPYYFSQTGELFEYIKNDKFSNYIEEISCFIEDDFALEKLFDSWCELKGESKFIQLKNLIGMTDEVPKAIIKNLFTCEAHNELLTNYGYLLTENDNLRDMKYKRLMLKYRQIRAYLEMDKKDITDVLLKNEDVKILWGVSKRANEIAKRYEKCGCVVIIVDKDVLKQGMYWNNHKIQDPISIAKTYDNATWHICTSENFHKQIEKELLDMGICSERIICEID